MTKQRLVTISAAVGLYLLTTGTSAWAFGAFRPRQAPTPISPVGSTGTKLSINPTEPKDQACPINGKYFTKTEKVAWEQERPALVMIENHPDARPQSGLSRADVVYEAVAEGGITRFMGVFYCGAIADQEKVAPVRSARIYFVTIAAEYNNPIYVHVGGGNCSRDEASNQCTSDKRAWALEELAKIGWRKAKGNDFDTISDIGKPVLYRDESRLGTDKSLAVEHTMVGSLFNIWKEATKRGFTGQAADGTAWVSGFRQWKFMDGVNADKRGNINTISFEFWSGYNDFSVRWEYDGSLGAYKRFNGGNPHTDLENSEQLFANNIVIQFAKEEGPIDDHKHMLYQIIGKGKTLIFQDGKVIEGTWEKKDQKSRTVFTDKNGKEILFVRGPIWVEVVPANNEISY